MNLPRPIPELPHQRFTLSCGHLVPIEAALPDATDRSWWNISIKCPEQCGRRKIISLVRRAEPFAP